MPSIATLSTKAKEPRGRIRSKVADMRSLEEWLTKHQLASAKMISILQKEIISQSQKYNAEKAELMGTIARIDKTRTMFRVNPNPNPNPNPKS